MQFNCFTKPRVVHVRSLVPHHRRKHEVIDDMVMSGIHGTKQSNEIPLRRVRVNCPTQDPMFEPGSA